jgi:hypothetical protein
VNEYQELINWLHGHYIETGDAEVQQAADAIETLQAERDGAVADIVSMMRYKDNCNYCAKIHEPCDDIGCSPEWRGLQGRGEA